MKIKTAREKIKWNQEAGFLEIEKPLLFPNVVADAVNLFDKPQTIVLQNHH